MITIDPHRSPLWQDVRSWKSTTRATIAALDPGVSHVGLAVRTYALNGDELGKTLDTFNLKLSGITPLAAAKMVIMSLEPGVSTLRLLVCEDFAYAAKFGVARLGQFVGAVSLWCDQHTVAFARIPISRIKKACGLKGNCNRRLYVEYLRQTYPRAASDDSRVALAILDHCAHDCWGKSWEV